MKLLVISGVIVLIGLIVTVVVNDYFFVKIGEAPSWARAARAAVIAWWGLLAIWAILLPRLVNQKN